MQINADMTIAEIIRLKPEAAKILQQFNMHCIGCAVAACESLSEAAKAHHIELGTLLKAINS